MGQSDPNVNFRMPTAMRGVAVLVTEAEDFGDLSDLMRRTLQDRLYLFIGKTLVKTMKWDAVLRLLHDCLAVPRVQIPVPVKSGQKGP